MSMMASSMEHNALSNIYKQLKHNDNILPYIIWVNFQNPDITTNHHQKCTYLYSAHNTNRQWTPIIKIKRTFIVKDHWIHRIQFPL